MTAILLFVIAILLFIIARSLNKSADSIEAPTPSVSSNVQQQKPKVEVSYWESYQKSNPELAKELVKLTKGRIGKLSDKDVKETISSFDHTAKTNSLQSYESAYQLVLNKMKEFLEQSYPNVVLGVLDNIIKEEVKQTGKRPTNTMSSYVKAELETIIEDKLKAMSPEDLFKYRIKEALQQTNEKYEWNNDREGFDSPLAQEVVNLMRRMLDNEVLMMTALKFGYGGTFESTIVDEMESFISENCHTSLQEAINYHDNKDEYNDPYKRCPNCGSANITEGDPDEGEYWCNDCHHDWYPHLLK
ncbi:MAG: TFIIB-type zinc ribbon-containing protein [Paraprevotella sp.]|nr:TFIIB-type zinc ribbon-containing protein [Paraprevotella sp.]